MKSFNIIIIDMNDTSKTNRFLAIGKTLFSSRRIIIFACILIVVGYFLMAGSSDSDIFSPRRIAVAPLLCLSGYLLIVVGILRND